MGSFSIPWPFKRSKALDSTSKLEEEEANLEEHGVTKELQDFIKGFTIDTFKDYALQDDQNVKEVDRDLTEWQERHAMLVLSKVKEVAKLRYVLCPRHLKERQFWRIYFLLVKSHVAPYEMHAIAKAKIRMLEQQNEITKGKATIEVEMTDTKHTSNPFNTLQSDSELFVDKDISLEKVEDILTKILTEHKMENIRCQYGISIERESDPR